ncbi:MAG: hyfB [Planctomycetaceae bacterium]|nr:hyfB [Planctomycetaceae bacterium]
MELLLAAIVALIGSGIVAWALQRWPTVSTGIAAAGALGAAVLGIIPAWNVLVGSCPTLVFSAAWPVPGGRLALELDPLSAWFLFPVLIVPALATIYAGEALCFRQTQRRVGAAVFLLNLLTAAMVVVVVARNGLLFLAAWEVAAVAASLLILFEHDRPAAQQAGWYSFVAAQLGAAFLFGLFAVLGQHAGGSLQFADFALITNLTPAGANVLFGLALIGFGAKAGLIPFHSWLPPAYSAACSHVPAVLSGVHSKLAVYGFLRVLSYLGPPPNWWGWVLIVIGLLSGLTGIVLALAQSDLKKLLAYSSIENLGIIFLSLGLGLLGLAKNDQTLLVLGFAGALFHVWNHSLFKGLLFLATGIVELQAGTTNINLLGGQIKRLPWTAGAFLIGSVSICGLPPFNGFASEFLIYLTAFDEEAHLSTSMAVPALVALGGLALISGLAAVAFTKAFGLTFLGAPRSAQAAAPGMRVGWRLRLPVLLLAIGCYACGLLAPRIIKILEPVVAVCIREMASPIARSVNAPISQIDIGPLQQVVVATSGLILIVLSLTAIRWILLRRREVGRTVTWDCGYAAPAASMQYTGTSYVQPTTELFGNLVPVSQISETPNGLFPTSASLKSSVEDPYLVRFYQPVFKACGWGLLKLRGLQNGQANLYVLYVAVTLIALLAWQLGWSR